MLARGRDGCAWDMIHHISLPASHRRAVATDSGRFPSPACWLTDIREDRALLYDTDYQQGPGSPVIRPETDCRGSFTNNVNGADVWIFSWDNCCGCWFTDTVTGHVEDISSVSVVNHSQRDLFSVQHHLTRHRLRSDRQIQYSTPSMKQKSVCFFFNDSTVKQTPGWVSTSFKGALCSFSEDVLMKSKWSSFVFLQRNTFSMFPWLNKQTDLKRQHSFILFYFVYMWRTLPPFYLQTVFCEQLVSSVMEMINITDFVLLPH